jgi:hypothetical protein
LGNQRIAAKDLVVVDKGLIAFQYNLFFHMEKWNIEIFLGLKSCSLVKTSKNIHQAIW